MKCTKRILGSFCAVLLAAVVGLSLTGCSGSQEAGLSFEDFAKEEQSLSCPELPWGTEAADVREAIDGKIYISPIGADISYQEIPENLEGYTGNFFPEKEVSFCGMKWEPQFQFENGKLWSVSLSRPISEKEDGNEQFDQLVKQAQEAFGPETEAQLDQGLNLSEDLEIEISSAFTFSTYIWERTDENGKTTKAMLSSNMVNGTVTSIEFIVNLFPNES